MKRYLFTIFLAALVSTASAATIGRHPGFIPLHGYGIDLRNPDLPKPPVASLDFAQPESYAGNGSAQFSVHFSQHKLDLARHFARNASLSVKSMVFNGRANFSYVDNTRYSGNTLNFAFVCTRDYGTTTYTNASVGPQFSEEVNIFRHTNQLSGPALSGAISDRFGTHYIKGHRSVGKVVVIYTFHFDSTTTTRDLTASLDARYRGGVTTVNFQTDVRSLFEQTASRVSMTSQFYSSDPSRPILFSTNAITSYADFLAFSDAVVNYCNTQMTPAGGERSEFVVDQIENLRGYCALVGNCATNTLPNTDYDRWMDAYGQLARWDDTLTGWAIDPRRMSWMNTNGQRMMLGMRRDVTNYRRTLEATARRHFETGEPLVVPNEIFNYFANFSRIPLPTINIVEHAHYRDNHLWIGYVNSGPVALTVTNAFLQIMVKENPATFSGGASLYSQPAAFEGQMGSFATEPAASEAIARFTSSSVYSILKQPQADCRIEFFVIFRGHEADYSLFLRDGAGGVVEEVDGGSFSSTICPELLNASVDSDAKLDLASHVAATAALDSKTSTAYTVTNLSLSPSYGTLALLPIPAGMQALAARGSQGQAIETNDVLVVTNGQVFYEVGPLAYGSSATIHLDLVPLRTGVVMVATSATVTVGEGLIDPNPANNTVLPLPLTIVAPRLSAARTAGSIELSWVSETGRLNLQSVPTLSATSSWLPVTNAPTLIGSTRNLLLPATSARKFYRLQMPPL